MLAVMVRWVVSALCLFTLLNAEAAQLSTHYSYDEAGNKNSQTDAQGRITLWTYSLTNQITSRTLPDGNAERFSYDSRGNTSSHTDFNGKTTGYAYDLNDRVTLVQYPDGRNIKTTYTASGRIDTTTESQVVNGKTVAKVTRYSYDIMDRLLKVELPTKQVISYSYDAAGRLLSRSTTNGTTRYAYDVADQLIDVTDAQGQVTHYEYDAANRLTKTVYPNATQSLREYSANGYLQQIAWLNAQQSIVTATQYTLSANGQRSAITRYDNQSAVQISSTNGQPHWELTNPSYQMDYSYDSEQRLTGEHHHNLRDNSELQLAWTYDSVGNRLTQTKTQTTTQGNSSTETITYGYDARDRLLNAKTVTNTGSILNTDYVWDASGRLIKKITPTQITLYTWRSDDRLLEIKQGNTEATAQTVAKYSYDSQGNRIQRVTDSVTTDYLTDTNFTYAQTLEETDTQAGNQQVTRYEWGNGLITATNNSQHDFYHADGLGNINAVTGSQGQIVKAYDYEAFGSPIAQSADDANAYRYTGEYSDLATGLQYNRARWYDRETGRFISGDKHLGDMEKPITLNKYLYSSVDGANKKDPSGFIEIGDVTIAPSISMNLSSTSILYIASRAIVAAVIVEMYSIYNDFNLTLNSVAYGSRPIYTAEEETQLDLEYQRIKKPCDDFPKPTGDRCQDFKNLINHLDVCVSLYSDWDTKWWKSRHFEKIQNWKKGLKAAKKRYKNSTCPQE